MFEPQEIRSEHKDVIHDVLYDYYGQRIATCSSDQTVKVYLVNVPFQTYVIIFIAAIFYNFLFRFGTKTKRVYGLFPHRGKHIRDQYGA